MALDRRTTLDAFVPPRAARDEEASLGLTIVWHPDPRRVGRAATLRPNGEPAGVSRLEPAFDDGLPLDDPAASRTPLRIARAPHGGVHLLPGREGLP
ncbi:MAG: hypothetical protein ACOZNI_13810, partial [Myxococcota bacterium]